jgi:DNA-directed RNA polymerase II subunit RPB1
MPAGFNQATSDIETVVGVQFSIKSPKEIEDGSVVEITTQATFEGNEPKIGGLFDPRMGVLENGKICRSCGQTNHGCPGHFGHFRLTRPVYFIQFHEKIMNILRCVCIRCAKLKIDKNLRSTIMAKKEENRWRDVLKACSAISRCGQEIEDGCGATQPSKYERKGIANIVAHFPADGEKEGKEQMLEVEFVHRLFRRISDEDVDFMGFSRFWCRPDWMICTVLPIPPPQMRPSVVQDNNTRSEDDLTHKLFEIIKSDRILQEKIDRNSPKSTIDEHANIVQYHVATLVDNQIPGVAPSAQRSGRPLKSIQQRIGSKEGRIRYNIQGKRVEFSARSVITPDPNLSIDELGVPLEIATNLTFPERVTVYNRDKLYKLVQNGADIYPGAKTVVKPDGRMISLKHVNTKEIVLYNGDLVNRHLLDGDIVLFNRQPTLHKMSMMAHRVKVLPGKTFRLNVLVTRPYNADFDGDEMNMHCPQSYEAATELEEIAAIPHNIVSPRHAKPLIGVFQDSVVGSYRLTRSSVELTRREFMNLMMRNKRFEGIMPPPNGINRYTGKQVLSQLLPPMNLEMGNKAYDKDKKADDPDNFVKIKQGEITQGLIDSSVYMSSGKGIIHTLYNDYGSKDTSMFLDSLQRVVEDYLVLDGFSVGISDLVADEETAKSIQKVIADCKKKIEEIQFQVHTDIFENNTGKTNQQEFEDQAFGFLKQATSTASSAVKKSLSPENRLVAMINSGSKGDWVNIAQMIACLGQQAIENKRIAYGFTDRTLPHYKKYDDGAEARGFIDSSFIKGLTAQQFFFHAMSGREGLIDTAVKTAETGYIQRQLIKAMEDIVVQHDGTVRDANMNVVQFYYGEDGIMATKLESQSLPLDTKLSREDIKQQFGLKNVDWSTVLKGTIVREQEEEGVLVEAFVEQVLEDQRILIEEMYQGSMYSGSVNAPVNLSRLILNVKTRFNLDPKAETDLTPTEVLQRIPVLIERTESSHVRIWCALLRCYLAPHKLIVKERFTKDAFDALCELIVVGHMKSWVQPGEQVGIIAAQSIGEPSTQLTLNTFHLAGVASKSNVNQGIPRLREILKVTKNPKATSLLIYMKPEYRHNKEKARELVQDLELTLLRNITNKVAIYWDPTDEDTVIAEDRDLLEFYNDIESKGEKALSKWLLRLELNREEMFNKNISMADVVFVIKMMYDDNVNTVYSDYNADKLIMRIRITEGTEQDDFTHLKKFQSKLLNQCVIRGVPGIKAVTFREDKQKVELGGPEGRYSELQQYVLDTDGSNYVKVMNHPLVDASRLYTTNIHDIMDILGLEAVRAILIQELIPIFGEDGVNYRHLGMLCDYITRSGRLMSIDRYGINKNDVGPLGKMSFEETSKIVMNAAMFGEVDPVTGVSANIMMGQPIRGGTAFSQILLDDAMLEQLTKGLEAVPEDEEEVEGDLSQFEQAEDVFDPCGRTQFQMNMMIPESMDTMEDEAPIDLYIKGKAEAMTAEAITA